MTAEGVGEGEGQSALTAEEISLLHSGRPDLADIDHAPALRAESIAAALLSLDGAVVVASPAFHVMEAHRHISSDAIAAAARAGVTQTEVVDLGPNAEDSAVFAYARADLALGWRIPPDVKQAAAQAPRQVVVVSSQPSRLAQPLETACRAFGLSGLQTRVVMETIRRGTVRSAAKVLGISYHTAREASAEAMARVRAPRLAALVNKLGTLAIGVLPSEDAAEVLSEFWGLSARQAAVAALIAEGLSRSEAARALGISEALVRKEQEQVYELLQVRSTTALARKLVETRALRWFTEPSGGDIGFIESAAEPLQFVHRSDGSAIAVSDYGPASASPVLVVHSSMTSRIVARGLLRALHAAGRRPIAIDRPGFGMTDEVAGARAGRHDPYATAADDAIRVLDHLKIRSIDVVTRGGAKFVLALHGFAPERIGRVVLVNPSPHGGADSRDTGAFGAMKRGFRRSPAAVRLFAASIAGRITYDGFVDLLRRWMKGSPPDELAIQDSELVRDFFRAQRPLATGRVEGFVNEQTEFATGGKPDRVVGTKNWRVLIAVHDSLHDPDDVMAYWRDVLPDAEFRLIDDAGRLLSFSHPHYVVEALT
jgi:pimeloyl-ACP methyl ester carboxylesterase/DNA-binding NarL/FixJ family response regulator